MTDRNAIQGQSRNTLSDLTYTIETKPSAITLYLFWMGSETQGLLIDLFTHLYRDIGELDLSSFQFSGARVIILLNKWSYSDAPYEFNDQLKI